MFEGIKKRIKENKEAKEYYDYLMTTEGWDEMVEEMFGDENEVAEKKRQKLEELVKFNQYKWLSNFEMTFNEGSPLMGVTHIPGSRTIPTSVRREVWRRDGGKCSKCGSRENLEFDHIVPVSKGGSNTARNIELLCEKCNRTKSDKI